jgi:hypothetical protein
MDAQKRYVMTCENGCWILDLRSGARTTTAHAGLEGHPLEPRRCDMIEPVRREHEETRNVARSVIEAVRLACDGKFERPDENLHSVRPK